MKKWISMLLVCLIAVGLSGCAEAEKTKELPANFADAQSILDYLEQQNEIYVQTSGFLCNSVGTRVRQP